MDILAGLRDKLRFIESFYETASQPFREVKRKIEAGEDPYTSPSFNFDDFVDGTPPFLAEWQDADESLNLIGQAALTLVQESLYHYLQSFLELKGSKLSAKAPNRLERYRKHFRESLSIDWDRGPVPFEKLEEINLARNDIAHQGGPFAMTRYQSTDHYTRFPFGLFVHDIDRLIARESSGHPWPNLFDGSRLFANSLTLIEPGGERRTSQVRLLVNDALTPFFPFFIFCEFAFFSCNSVTFVVHYLPHYRLPPRSGRRSPPT